MYLCNVYVYMRSVGRADGWYRRAGGRALRAVQADRKAWDSERSRNKLSHVFKFQPVLVLNCQYLMFVPSSQNTAYMRNTNPFREVV